MLELQLQLGHVEMSRSVLTFPEWATKGDCRATGDSHETVRKSNSDRPQ